jgi:hypothetical protein
MLQQKFHGPSFPRSPANAIVFFAAHEDDRNILSTDLQFPLEIKSGDAWHSDVQQQAFRLTKAIRHEKLRCKRERSGVEAELPQQIRQRTDSSSSTTATSGR